MTWKAVEKFREQYFSGVTDLKFESRDSWVQVIDGLRSSKAAPSTNKFDFAVVAVENNCDGFYPEVIKQLAQPLNHDKGVRVVDECVLPIYPELIMPKVEGLSRDEQLQRITTIYTHPSLARQCSGFFKALREQKPKWKILFCESSGTALRLALDSVVPLSGGEDHKVGCAIALGFAPPTGPNAFESTIGEKEVYIVKPAELTPLIDTITDIANSVTRFWLLGSCEIDPSENAFFKEKPNKIKPDIDWKTCFLLKLDKKKSGELKEVLTGMKGAQAEQGDQGDLRSLATVSSLFASPNPYGRGPDDVSETFEYVFFLEVKGHYSELKNSYLNINNYFKNQKSASECLLIGSYPDRAGGYKHPGKDENPAEIRSRNLPESSTSEPALLDPKVCRKILHLSDLHLTENSNVDELTQAIYQDCEKENFMPNLLLITGDFVDRGDQSAYRKALKYVSLICSKFRLDLDKQCLIVPGNHDLDLKTKREDVIDSIPCSFDVRLVGFSQFYKDVTTREYPLHPDKQFDVYSFEELGLQFVLLNSVWNIHSFNNSPSLNSYALASAIEEANNQMANKKLLRICVWHNPIKADKLDDKILSNTDLIDRHGKTGFLLGFHGDAHTPKRETRHESTPPIQFVGGGSAHAISDDIPCLYNQVSIHRSFVQVRMRIEQEDKSWGGHKNWGGRNGEKIDWFHLEIPFEI
jgi:prephenate dehydratase/predicted MPP superfamily phosphohydrolase